LQKLAQNFDNVEAYGEFVEAEFQETPIRGYSSSWRFQNGDTNHAERNILYRQRKRHKRQDAAWPSSSADSSDSDPPVDVDIDASLEGLSVLEM
jgi:hypothetical protein